MKILFITNMYPSKQKRYAGIFVKNQYEELKNVIQENDEIDIFYMKRAFTSKLGSILKYLIAFLKFIPYLFKKYDILHVHYFYPLILLAWLKKKLHKDTKIVVTFLGRDINAQINERNRKFFKRIAKEIDFSIPVGTTLAKKIELKLNLKRIKVLPCGVDDQVFYKMDDQEKTYDFIMVGSFIHRKGIDTIISAIRSLSKDSKIKFCFCGSGDHLPELKELQEEYDITIKENQTQEQLRVLLNSSRFFLLMSRAEGFATATTEALFCGVPVLTSDIDNFKEQVEIGINGYISPVNDVHELKRHFIELTSLEESKYEELAVGAKNSLKQASLRNVCNEIYEIYRKLRV